MKQNGSVERRSRFVLPTTPFDRPFLQRPENLGQRSYRIRHYHYKYASGHEGDCFVAGFAPRKTALTLYITAGVERFPKLLANLGKHKAGKGCLYIKKLDDVNLEVLEALLSKSVEWTRTTYKS